MYCCYLWSFLWDFAWGLLLGGFSISDPENPTHQQLDLIHISI